MCRGGRFDCILNSEIPPIKYRLLIYRKPMMEGALTREPLIEFTIDFFEKLKSTNALSNGNFSKFLK